MTLDGLSADLGDEVGLRPLEEGDADELFALTDRNRGHLAAWMPWVDGTVSVDDTRTFLRTARGQVEAGTGVPFALVVGGQIAGVAGFNAIDGATRTGAIGYWLDEGRQGAGLMTRAVAALLELGFGPLGLNRITIDAAVENTRSRAIPERLGFTQEGIRREAEWVAGRPLDHASYALLAREWKPGGRAEVTPGRPARD